MPAHVPSRTEKLGNIIIALLVLFFILVSVLTLFVDREVTFNVNAQTEILSGMTPDKKNSVVGLNTWRVRNATLCHGTGAPVDVELDATAIESTDCLGFDGMLLDFTGELVLAEDTAFTLIRIVDGRLSIRLESVQSDTGAKVAQALNDDRTTDLTLKDEALILLSLGSQKDAHSYLFPVQAYRMVVGQELPFDPRGVDLPLLREGEVSLTDRTLIESRDFDGGRVILGMGDSFLTVEKAKSERGSPHGTDQERQAKFTGAILVNQEPGMKVLIRAVSKAGWVTRPYSTRLPVASTWYERLIHDRVIAVLISGVLFLFAFSQALVSWRQLWGSKLNE